MTNESAASFPSFKSINLMMVEPDFRSELTDLIISLDSLRRVEVGGSTPEQTFFQIKNIFHILESIGSARIEGNRTTVIEYIDQKMEKAENPPDSFKEIENMEIALQFIDDHIGFSPVDRAFVSELHKLTVRGLSEEGSVSPGVYRNQMVTVSGSELVPPPPGLLESLMEEMFRFISRPDAPKYDLLKVALAHHRFVWIHPFDNGNGRTGRLLTYALLIKFGFNVHLTRVLNPAAIFCWDRNEYYRALARADRGDDEGRLLWAKYMLSGLQREMTKTDKLMDYAYLKKEILMPTIAFSLEKSILNAVEAKVLALTIEKREIANSDIRTCYPAKHPADISRLIRKLLDKKYLVPVKSRKRIYTINFKDNALVRGVIFALAKAGFLPENE